MPALTPMDSLRTFSALEDRGPFNPSWIITHPHPPRIDRNKRAKELRVLMEEERYKHRRANVETGIAMYENNMLPDLKHVQGLHPGGEGC
jgi:hypothetical protein